MHYFKYILIVLKLHGIDIAVKRIKRSKRCISVTYLFAVIFHLICFERMFNVIILTLRISNMYKIFVAFKCNIVTTIILWNIFNSSRKRIARVLNNLQEASICLPRKRRDKVLLTQRILKYSTFILCILPFVYAIGETCTLLYYRIIIFLLWDLSKEDVTTDILLYLRGFCSSIQRDTFPGILCVFYCSMCWEIRQLLLEYRNLFKNIIKTKSYCNFPKQILMNYSAVLDLVEDFDDCFSHTIFILTILNTVSVFSLMGICFYITHSGTKVSPFLILQISVILVTSATYLVCFIIAAAQIPIEIDRNATDVVKIYQEMKYSSMRKKQDSMPDCVSKRLLKMIIKRPTITLSGCHIVYFSRSLILTIIGTLVTYGLLVLNFD